MKPSRVLLALLFVVAAPAIRSAPLGDQASYDSCDWTGSGLTTAGAERVVVPIYLRCLQGTVRWLYPSSALQVTLNSHGHQEFRGCIRVAANSTSRVRVYVEGVYQSLHKLYAADDGRHRELQRCFASHDGQVALYLEADATPALVKEHFEFAYHLEPVASNEVLHDDREECRPCTDYETHTAYCTSDFVMRGAIQSLFDNEPLQRTELTIRAVEIKRDLVPPQGGNTSSGEHIVLHRPLKCHSKAGLGTEFLFLGHWVLGNPVIKCAPTIAYWKHVKSRAIATGANQCQLD